MACRWNRPTRAGRGARHPVRWYNARMAKTTTKPADRALSASEKVILFVAAAGISPAAVGIVAHALRKLVVRGLIERDGAGYKLTPEGRGAFAAILKTAGFS